MRISFFILLSILLLPVSAMAQGHNVYCDMADSTAATQSCLKKHLDAAQARLKKVYDGLLVKLDTEEKRSEVKDLQKTWLEYRDAECMWEMEQTETPSLKRINELSCMARVTDDRADLLTVIAMDTKAEGGVREYGSFPRWMNVLAKDHPTIYWDYGKRFGEDLNCDAEPEQIMTGTVLKKEGELLKQEIVVAVTQNPPTGRPEAKLFKFDISDEKNIEGSLCSAQINLSVAEEKPSEEDKEACLSFLEIKHHNCLARKIKWNGSQFELEKLPVPKEVAQEEEKE